MKAAALPQTLPLPLIRHLRMITLNYFMKRSVMIQVGKIGPFCINFNRRVSRRNSIHQQRQQRT